MLPETRILNLLTPGLACQSLLTTGRFRNHRSLPLGIEDEVASTNSRQNVLTIRS